MTSLLGTFATDVGPADRIAEEFPIFGDFVADLVVGSASRRAYCLIELEEGSRDAVFAKLTVRATKEWGRRFERGFSQLVDWFFALDDVKNTQRIARDYGPGYVSFTGLLIIGRSGGMTEDDRRRLRWRRDRVLVDSHKIHCLTFDDVHDERSARRLSPGVPTRRITAPGSPASATCSP